MKNGACVSPSEGLANAVVVRDGWVIRMVIRMVTHTRPISVQSKDFPNKIGWCVSPICHRFGRGVKAWRFRSDEEQRISHLSLAGRLPTGTLTGEILEPDVYFKLARCET